MALVAVVGLVSAGILSRNKFLLANVKELFFRFIHFWIGDNFYRIRSQVKADPWYGNQGVAIVTGSNSGMGFETAKELANTGAHIILAVRNKSRGDQAAQKIKEATGSDKVEVMLCDMTSVSSVRDFADAFAKKKLPLHVLVHNAGATGKIPHMNTDGLEDTMALNYLNVVLLTSLLLPILKSTSPSRVVIVGSSAHFAGTREAALCFGDRPNKPVSGWNLYGSSKLNVVAYSKILSRRLSGCGVNVCSLDPGFVATSFYKKDVPFPVSLFALAAGLVAKTAETGSHSSLFASLSPKPATGGAYIVDTLESVASSTARDESFQEQLMRSTSDLLRRAAPWWDGVWY